MGMVSIEGLLLGLLVLFSPAIIGGMVSRLMLMPKFVSWFISLGATGVIFQDHLMTLVRPSITSESIAIFLFFLLFHLVFFFIGYWVAKIVKYL